MRKFRVAFYRAKFDLWNVIQGKRKMHLIDDGINVWTAVWNFPWLPCKGWGKKFRTWWTSPYSHAETWTPDEEGRFVTVDWNTGVPTFYGTCWTSTMRKSLCPYCHGTKRVSDGMFRCTYCVGTGRIKHDGVVKRTANEIFEHPERWDWGETQVDTQDYFDMVQWMEDEVANNKGYDKVAIASFFLPKRIYKGTKKICSEFVHNALVIVRIFTAKFLCPSPRRLAKWWTQQGYTVQNLGKIVNEIKS